MFSTRTSLITAALCAAMALPASSLAQFIPGTGVFVCANCATSPQQAASFSQQVAQYAQEVITAARAVQMVDWMITEGKQLVTHPSTNIMTDLGMLSSILIQAQGLAGDVAKISNQFQNTYAPYSPNALTDYASQYNAWATTALKSINGALMSSGYQGSMLLNTEGDFVSQIQGLASGSLGRDESIQLTNSIAAQQVSQLQALRQLMMADVQSKSAFMAGQINQQQSAQVAQQSAFAHADWTADPRSW